MKRTFRLLTIMVLAALSFQSCLFEQKDIFEESSSNRLQHALEAAQKVLVSAENGWLFEMYPDKDQSYGGYAFVCKFNEKTVEVYTELAEDASESVTSYYKMSSENGPVLTFDTYNDYLHLFATPWGSSSGYEAYHGEYAFVIEKVEDDLITLRGSRTGNVMYLRKMNDSGLSYIEKVNEVNGKLIMSALTGSINGKKVDVDVDLDNRNLAFIVDGDEENAVETAFCVTDTGFRLYEGVEVAGKAFDSLRLSEDGLSFDCAGDKLDAVFPEGWRPYAAYAGNYILHYEQSATLIRDVTVTLTPKGDGTTYLLSGLNSNYTVEVKYRLSSGKLYWNSQQVGTAGANNVWLCAWDSVGGTLTWSTDAGVMTEWNGDEAKPVYNLVNNGETTYNINSFILWQLTSANASVGEYSNTAWRITGSTSTRLRNVTTLTKID